MYPSVKTHRIRFELIFTGLEPVVLPVTLTVHKTEVRFELTIEGLQPSALPLCYSA